MGEDTGETSQSYLEKITPKDLVMFSPTSRKVIAKNDFNYLDVDYDLQLPDQQQMDNIRVWGLPQLRLFDPIPLGLFIGFGGASLFNFWRRKPVLTTLEINVFHWSGSKEVVRRIACWKWFRRLFRKSGEREE
ncbi:hypothetical protein BpHYR1_002761, partial [Brachionus plicatilis]